MVDKQLFLIDATAFCYRAFYALSGLSTSFGQPTNAVYGFTVMLLKLLKEKKPDYLAVCFDVSRATFRQKRFAEYKIKRPPMPDSLSSQMPFIKDIVSAFGITVVEKEGFEADDVIATLNRKAKDEGFLTTIVSSDKDIMQLVDERTSVISPHRDEDAVYDAKKVKERFAVEPKKITDVITLMGDAVDNIPGVPGIGEKTAVELLKTFGSLERLLAEVHTIENERVRKAITENIERIKLNKELVSLQENIELDFAMDALKVKQQNSQELFRLFKHLEFKKLLKELVLEDSAAKTEVSILGEKDLKNFISQDNELFLFGENISDMVFNTKGVFFTVPQSGDTLRAALTDPGIRKSGHDLKKLKVSLARQGYGLEGMYFDTMLAAYLLNPSGASYSVTDIGWEYLGSMHKPDSLDNAKALDLIMRLEPKLEAELKEKLLWRLFAEIEMPLVSVLADMELSGIAVDSKVLKELSNYVEGRLGGLIQEIYQICDCQFNINSPKQLREVLFERLKLPVVKRTKSGPSTDEEVLRTLANQHRLPALLIEYRQLMKLKNTYIDVLPGLIDPKTGRVHTSFNQTGTETGRLSSSNPNLQNIPVKTEIGKKIRQAIVASQKNNLLASFDYSQIELRILAHLSGEPSLIAAFRANKDIHRLTASLLSGLKEQDIQEPMRENAKRVNFGIIYGLSAFGLSRDLGLSQEEAQNFIDAYFLRYPKVKEYINRQIEKARKDGFVTTILGRRRYIPQIHNKNQALRQFAERQAVNTPIQGSASDLIKLAMIQIHKEMLQNNLAAKMLLQIHDELLFDSPEAEIKDLIFLVRERMENGFALEVPIKVQAKQGKNWLEMEEV